MATEPIVCSQCGAPLSIPAGVNFVTCNHCQASLSVRREASVTYTQTLEKLARQADEIAGHVAELRREQEVARIEREWERQRQSLLVTSKRGHAYVPTRFAGVFAMIVGGGFGLFWTLASASIATRAPGPFTLFPLFGVVFILAALGVGFSMISKANEYERAHAAYQRRLAAAQRSAEERT